MRILGSTGSDFIQEPVSEKVPRQNRMAKREEISDICYRALEMSYYHSLPYAKCIDIITNEYGRRGIEVDSGSLRSRLEAAEGS